MAGVSDFYRFSTYVVVAIICNSLVALDLQQVNYFAAFSLLTFFAYAFGMLMPKVGAADPEFRTIAVTLLGVISLANVIVGFSARASDELIKLSASDAARNRDKAENLGRLIDGSRGSLRIGEELGQKAEESIRDAMEVRSRIAALENRAQNLASDARSTEESNNKVANFTAEMRDSVIDQNKMIHETSAALGEIAETVSRLAKVATDKRSGIDAVLAGFNRQREEMAGVVESMERISYPPTRSSIPPASFWT